MNTFLNNGLYSKGIFNHELDRSTDKAPAEVKKVNPKLEAQHRECAKIEPYLRSYVDKRRKISYDVIGKKTGMDPVLVYLRTRFNPALNEIRERNNEQVAGVWTEDEVEAQYKTLENILKESLKKGEAIDVRTLAKRANLSYVTTFLRVNSNSRLISLMSDMCKTKSPLEIYYEGQLK